MTCAPSLRYTSALQISSSHIVLLEAVGSVRWAVSNTAPLRVNLYPVAVCVSAWLVETQTGCCGSKCLLSRLWKKAKDCDRTNQQLETWVFVYYLAFYKITQWNLF